MRTRLMVMLLATAVGLSACGRASTPVTGGPSAQPASAEEAAAKSNRDKVIAGNLRVTADANLPVPTTVITATSLPAPTLQDFVDQTHVQPSPDAVQRVEREGWVFSFHGDRILLKIEERTTTGEGNTPVATYLEYRFPRGSLKPDAELATIVAQLRASLSGSRVGATRVEASVPRSGPTEYAFWLGVIDLKPLAREYAESPASYRDQWSREEARAWSTSSQVDVPVDMLNLADGVRVGFEGKAFVTQSIKSGVSVTTWYEIPGLSDVSARAGE